MDFKIGAEVLASYVNIVSKVVNAKANMPILNNLLIEAGASNLTLTGTNLEIQVTAATQLKPTKTGKTSVNAKLFSQYMSTIPKTETVHVAVEKGILTVTSSVGAAEFATKDADDFPLFETGDLETLFSLPGETFSEMVDNTIFACAKDDIRPILTGINVEIENETVSMVALDTFRLSKMTHKSQEKYEGKKQLVIPSSAMEHIVRVSRDSFVSTVTDHPVVQCKLSKAGNYVLLSYGDVEVYARLIEGEYPAYKAVIPVAYETEATISRQSWLDSLKRVGVFAQSAIGQKVVLSIEEGKLKMEANVPEVGNITEEFPVTSEGNAVKIAFQSRFLLDILTLASDDVIVFRSTTKTAPGTFLQPTKDSFVHILMPLKLDD